MCGIAGIFHFDSKPVSLDLLRKMGDTLIHRGPDDEGIHIANHIGLIHRRLSIIDLSNNGHQPMHSQDGRYTIVFNGEIYNHTEFRNELALKGIHLKSSSDTEILLNLFIIYGEQVLHRLNGMFSFAIADQLNGELYLCRDRMGVKPLYYALTSDSLIFASEPKSLFAAGVSKSIHTENVQEWLLYRYVAGEETLFQGVKKLLPGHSMKISRDGNLITNRWYHLGERILAHAQLKNPTEWFQENFNSSVKYRMVSDVPVGVLLSGGLDSSSVVSELHKNKFQNIETFTIGFRDFADDESLIAKRLSESLGYHSHVIHLEDDALMHQLKSAIYHLDEPLVHQNDPQLIAISSHAASHVKVLLSGEGADELMGGYVRYKTFRYIRYRKTLMAILNLIPSHYKSGRLKKLDHYLSNQTLDELIATNACNIFQKDFEQLGIHYIGVKNNYRREIITEAKNYFPNKPLRQLLYYDQHTYLQSLNDRNDRATMAASIECREPFQDYRLVEGLGTLSTEYLTSGVKGKRILVESMKNQLPDYIRNFRKVGLSVPWLQLIRESESLSAEWEEFKKSAETGIPLIDFIDRKKLLNSIDQHDSAVHRSLALQLFMFHLWQKDYFKD